MTRESLFEDHGIVICIRTTAYFLFGNKIADLTINSWVFT